MSVNKQELLQAVMIKVS